MIFAPGKGTFYPEFFPDRYVTSRKTTNYNDHVNLAKNLAIHHIDFNDFLLRIKTMRNTSSIQNTVYIGAFMVHVWLLIQ
ncbi:MAG: hypothetical protein HC906_14245 [Bacteroidales bacterium]|nr:hypothetical protein [Bacteroidales bacterium]